MKLDSKKRGIPVNQTSLFGAPFWGINFKPSICRSKAVRFACDDFPVRTRAGPQRAVATPLLGIPDD